MLRQVVMEGTLQKITGNILHLNMHLNKKTKLFPEFNIVFSKDCIEVERLNKKKVRITIDVLGDENE